MIILFGVKGSCAIITHCDLFYETVRKYQSVLIILLKHYVQKIYRHESFGECTGMIFLSVSGVHFSFSSPLSLSLSLSLQFVHFISIPLI